MTVTVPIPDELVELMNAGGEDIPRRAIEALAAEEYRAGRLTNAELSRLLGFETRVALDEFFKARAIYESFEIADLEKDRADLDRSGFWAWASSSPTRAR